MGAQDVVLPYILYMLLSRELWRVGGGVRSLLKALNNDNPTSSRKGTPQCHSFNQELLIFVLLYQHIVTECYCFAV